MNSPSRSVKSVVWMWFAIFALVFLILGVFITVKASGSGYSHASLVTRYLQIETAEDLRWSFDEVTLLEPLNQTFRNVNMELVQNQNVVITKSKNGNIDISVRNVNEKGCAQSTSRCALLSGETDDGSQYVEYLPGSFRLSIKGDSSFVNGYSGSAQFGREYNDASSSEYWPLISGEILLYGRHSFGTQDGHYATSPIQITYGDSITIGGGDALTRGIFTNDLMEAGLRVSATSDVTTAKVSRYKTQGIELSNGILSRVYNDHGLGILWSSIFFALNFIYLAIRLYEKKDNELELGAEGGFE